VNKEVGTGTGDDNNDEKEKKKKKRRKKKDSENENKNNKDMSFHRVSSLDSFAFIPATDPDQQRSRRSSDVSSGSRPRKLSFGSLPESWDQLEHGPNKTVVAFEVPRWKRLREC
jgi:hypothetical protein